MFYGKMGGWVKAVMALSLVSITAFLMAGCGKFQAKSPYLPGEVLVQFKFDLSETEIRKIISSIGATVKDTIKQQNVYVLSFSSKISPPEMAEKLKKVKGVIWAEPNYQQKVFIFPVYAEEEYGLGMPDVAAPSSKPVIVAVIDTGVNANHSSLQGQVIQGYNFYNNTTDASGSASGLGWHGTAVSGRVIDGAGGANVQIMPLQVNDGQSAYLSSSAILKAIYYAADNGASVINMSFGCTCYSPLMQQAIDYAHNKGVILVAAAGNSGNDKNFYPAAYNNVISVGAANEQGRLAGFSNFGSYVDVIAPGWMTNVLKYFGEGKSNGTSFASPFIAGLAALFKYYFPGLAPDAVETELKSLARNADDLNPLRAGQMGAGFIGNDILLRLIASIKDGTFKLASGGAGGAAGGTATGGPWLLRGKASEGTYILAPDGTMTKQK